MGTIATVWHGEINCMTMGLKVVGNTENKVIIVYDSKAAIRAVINAGSHGKALTRDLMKLGNELRHRQGLYGPDNVMIGWVKAQIGIEGNEGADEMA